MIGQVDRCARWQIEERIARRGDDRVVGGNLDDESDELTLMETQR